MAKQSAADKLTARIDLDMAQIYAVSNYIGSDSTEALRARIDGDLARLKAMRDYVTTEGSAAAPTAKPKRTRTAAKPKPAPPQTNGE